MRLIIQPDYAKLSRWTAAYIAKKIFDFKPSAGKPFVLGLPTGSSPIGTFAELVRLHKEGLLSFAHVITFNMDEYVGLPEDHPQSYHTFMRRHLFDHVDIPRSGINHMWTASVMQLHPKAMMVCDEESTVELKVGTYRYFKDIEAKNLQPPELPAG